MTSKLTRRDETSAAVAFKAKRPLEIDEMTFAVEMNMDVGVNRSEFL